jgi:hypothetical protein
VAYLHAGTTGEARLRYNVRFEQGTPVAGIFIRERGEKANICLTLYQVREGGQLLERCLPIWPEPKAAMTPLTFLELLNRPRGSLRDNGL